MRADFLVGKNIYLACDIFLSQLKNVGKKNVATKIFTPYLKNHEKMFCF